jgi:hypothetical protein
MPNFSFKPHVLFLLLHPTLESNLVTLVDIAGFAEMDALSPG